VIEASRYDKAVSLQIIYRCYLVLMRDGTME
jgi:hypothetical protein